MADGYETIEEYKKLGHKKKSLVKTIRAHCLDCCNDSANEVKLCHINDCFLWPYRRGTNPFHTVKLSEEAKEANRARLKAMAEQNRKNGAQNEPSN